MDKRTKKLRKRIPKWKTNQMNWKAIKHIYRHVLIWNNKIEYLGEDRYKLFSFYRTGEKLWETEHQNGQLYGKETSWYKNGNKYWEVEYQNGKLHGKHIGWHRDGQKNYEKEYQNGERIK